MTNASPRVVEIENIGPIAHLKIPIPKAGVVVLEGPNGAGKTTAINAVTALVEERGGLQVRDGELTGRVEGLGCRLSVAQRTTRKGELEVVAIEGGDPSLLVDPGLKDPEAADAARIREIVRLARIQIPEQEWIEVVGSAERLQEIARPATLAERDPVKKARMLRDDCYSAALALERSATNQAQRASDLVQKHAGVDLRVEQNEKVLGDALEAAVAGKSALAARAAAAREAEERQEKARAGLEVARSKAVLSLADATAAREAAFQRSDQANARIEALVLEVKRLQAKLEEAEDAGRAALVAFRDAEAAEKRAQSHEDILADLQLKATAPLPSAPTERGIEEAEAAVQAAKDASFAGAQARLARADLQRAKEYQEAADTNAASAARLRECGKGAEGRLSLAIARAGLPGLTVEESRLIFLHPTRGKVFFCDLSEGEKYRIGFRMAVKAGGPNCVIPVRQEAWVALQPSRQKEVAEMAVEEGCVVLTGRPSDEELSAKVFEGGV